MKPLAPFEWRITLLWIVTVGVVPPGIDAVAQEPDTGPRVILSSGSAVEGAPRRLNPGVIREIDDPHLGIRWLLMADPRNAGGPGVLLPTGLNVAVAAVSIDRGLVPTVPVALSQGKPGVPVPVFAGGIEEGTSPKAPILRAGERIVIEEHTPVADAALNAIALSSSALGGIFTARLTAGGAIVRAVAMGAGRAVFAPEGRR